MKKNKHFHIMILLMFLFQTLFPPALLAQSSPPENQQPATRSLDELFDDSVSNNERQLLFEFVQYVTNSFAPRAGLRKASEELYKTLEKDNFWFSLDIKDPDMADLLAEANSGRRYLLEKTAPVESRLHAEQRRLEKQLLSDHERIVTTGVVPDGFMERTRGLASLYDSQDSLWEMKIALLYKISALSNNIVINYLSDHPEVYSEIKDKIDRSNTELDNMAGFAAHHNQQILELKARYQDIQNAFNGATASALSKDRIKTSDMITVVHRQSRSLERQGDANARNHADLLEQISQVLEERIVQIDQQLGQLGASDAFPNPLYIAPGLGASEHSRALADSYRDIARKLVNQIHLKANALKEIKPQLDDIKRSVGQEQIFFQTLVSEADSIPSDKKSGIMAAGTTLVNGFVKSLDNFEEELERINSQAGSLDFAKPDRIIGSRTDSAKAFHLNRKIENFMLAADTMDQDSIGMDARLYGMLSGLDIARAEQLKSYEMLEETSLSRDRAVALFSENISAAQKISDTDALLAGDLKKLGQNIIFKGQKFFKSKILTLSELLTQKPSAAGQPYFDFLTGVNEQLTSRLLVIDQMISMSKQITIPSGASPCQDCQSSSAVWHEMADIGTAYTDTLQQLDDLSDIETFFAPDKFSTDNPLNAALLMFDLSKRIGNQPFLHLNPDSIDVVFTAGSQMVVIKGIGDPQAVNFSVSALGTDHLIQPPYIGGWLSSTISSIGSKWIKPIGQGIYNTASKVVSTAKVLGGKIATTTSQMAQSAYNGAKKAVKTIGEYGSALLEGSQVWAINTWENAFMNDPKSYSWLKLGGYALGGVGCVAFPPLCVGLAIAVGVNVAQGAVDTAKDYGKISKDTAETIKLVLDVAGIIGGGLINIKNAGFKLLQSGSKAWQKLSKIQKVLTFMGMTGKDLKSLQTIWKADWSKIKKWSVMGKKLLDSAGAWRNIPDWYDKVAGWCGLQGLPTSSDILNGASGWLNSLPGADGLNTGAGGLISDLMGMGFPLPGLRPYPYSMGFDPFSPFSIGPLTPGEGAGIQLPGTGANGGASGSWEGGTNDDDGTNGGASGSWGEGTNGGDGTNDGASGSWGEGTSGGDGTNGGASGSWGEGTSGGTSGSWNGGGTTHGGTGPGVPLGPGAQTTGGQGQWTMPGQSSLKYNTPYKDWVNPYKNVTNPYKNITNPYKNITNPYKNITNPYR
jgi:hypothetical protein